MKCRLVRAGLRAAPRGDNPSPCGLPHPMCRSGASAPSERLRAFAQDLNTGKRLQGLTIFEGSHHISGRFLEFSDPEFEGNLRSEGSGSRIRGVRPPSRRLDEAISPSTSGVGWEAILSGVSSWPFWGILAPINADPLQGTGAVISRI